MNSKNAPQLDTRLEKLEIRVKVDISFPASADSGPEKNSNVSGNDSKNSLSRSDRRPIRF